MADGAIPEAGHAIDEFTTIGIPQEGSLSTDDLHERLTSWLGERVEEGTGHTLDGSGSGTRHGDGGSDQLTFAGGATGRKALVGLLAWP